MQSFRQIFITLDLFDTRYHVFIVRQHLMDVDQFFIREIYAG